MQLYLTCSQETAINKVVLPNVPCSGYSIIGRQTMADRELWISVAFIVYRPFTYSQEATLMYNDF